MSLLGESLGMPLSPFPGCSEAVRMMLKCHERHQNFGRNGVWIAALTCAAVVGAEPVSFTLSVWSCLP